MTEISEGMGYESVQDFSRVFKKRAGMTPSEFRQILH
ncbi:helix-turn-helix domain-containing protein [Reinekea marinisedimentorum]